MKQQTTKWRQLKVGDLGEYINGFAFKPEDWGSKGHPIIRIQNLTDPERAFNRTVRKIDEKYIVRTGDILVSWSATLDAFVKRGGGIVSAHVGGRCVQMMEGTFALAGEG